MATTASIRQVTTPTGDPAWLVTEYDTVKALLSDPRLGRSHPKPERAARMSQSAIFGGPMGSPVTDRSDHAQMRMLLSRSFSARRMERLRPRIQELVDRLFDQMEREARPIDFHEAISFPLPALVICELLGVPAEDRERFRRWSTDAGDMTDRERSRQGLARLQDYMRTLIERKRQHPAEDVISDLIAAQAHAPDRFTDDGVVELAAGLLFAGHETTVTAIDSGVVLLLTHAEMWDALRRDPTLVPGAVEEILRFPGPRPAPEPGQGMGLPRYANAAIELGGVTIQSGDLVLLALQAANRDARVFPEPETFDVTRTENPHLTFGHGPRFCVGAPLARIELQTVFASLVQRFPTLHLAVPVEELRHRRHLTGGLTALPVTW